MRLGLYSVAVALASSGGGLASDAWAQDETPKSGMSDNSGGVFPDVPATHWAYQAVQDLAAKGLVKGDKDGRFLGKRPLTRYEFAQVIDRILQTVAEINVKTAGVPDARATTPTGATVTIADLDRLQALVDAFKAQIDLVTADVIALKNAGYQTQIDALRKEIADLKTAVSRAGVGADRAYGFGAGRFQLGGFIQARFEHVSSGSQDAYPNGTTAVVGANNGNYQVGGTNESFYLRRARLRASGSVTDHTAYAIQIEAANATAATPISVREAYVDYTFKASPQYAPTVTVGQFRVNFGHVLPEAPPDQFAPERPLAFGDSGTTGLFENQNFDRGVQISSALNHSVLNATVALLNGNGINAISNKRRPDQLYRLSAVQPARRPGGGSYDFGVSFYNGEISRSSLGNPTGEPAFTGANYQALRKRLLGADLSVTSASGVFVQAEYVAGRYDQRTFVSAETADSVGTAVLANQYAPNNRVSAWYVQGGYLFAPATAHPLKLGVMYDAFRRSRSGVGASTVDQYGNPIAGGASGSSFDDGNFGYGGTYNLDRQTRLRVWYDQPTKVAHAANVARPKKIGLLTTELQVRF